MSSKHSRKNSSMATLKLMDYLKLNYTGKLCTVLCILTQLWEDEISNCYYIKLQLLAFFHILKFNMGKDWSSQCHLSICRYWIRSKMLILDHKTRQGFNARGIFVYSHVTQGQVTMKWRAGEREKTGDSINDKNRGTKNRWSKLGENENEIGHMNNTQDTQIYKTRKIIWELMVLWLSFLEEFMQWVSTQLDKIPINY